MKKKALFFIFLSVLAGLQIGTVRKKDNPVVNTQTAPILYEQKKEEEKDGVKGPLMYHVKNNPLETFFIEPPMTSEQKERGQATAAKPVTAPGDTADWWEEEPVTEGTPPVPAASPTTEPAFQDPAGEPSQNEESPKAEAEAPSEAKSEDYWW